MPLHRSPVIRSVLACLALATAMLVSPAQAASIPAPDDDPFYAAPAAGALTAATPGTIFKTRQIDSAFLRLPIPVKVWQVQYRTNDNVDQPEATVATIIVPNKVPRGGRNLVSYQTAEDTLSNTCATSYTLRKGTNVEQVAMLLPLLVNGNVVVTADYEGPKSAWVAGYQAGHATLDAIRATESFAPAGLTTHSKVGAWGYSGGGHATAWLSELAPSYAPEINLVGVAEGGVPAHLSASVAHVDGGPFTGIILAAAIGLDRGYPQLQLDRLLNPAGIAMKARVGGQCLTSFAGEYPFKKLADFTNVPNPLDDPQVKAALAANALGQRPPRVPVFMYHTYLDELNPIAATTQLVNTYCRAGTKVIYKKTVAGEHVVLTASYAPLANQFLADRFAGRALRGAC